MKYLILITALCLSGCMPKTLSDKEFQTYLDKRGCTMTNEFVGKEADRLYMCDKGIKYKSGTLWYWAYQDKGKLGGTTND